MTKLFAMIFVLGFALSAASPAEARGGCGIGWHPGPMGGCVRNGGVVVVAPRAVVGTTVVVGGRACPVGWHLGRFGHCRRNW